MKPITLHPTSLLAGAAATVLALLCSGYARQQSEVFDSIRARQISIVDEEGTVRLLLGVDTQNTERRDRYCGIVLFDKLGNERGGLGTFDDLSVVMALDAPAGVGAPMRDRIGLVVDPDGSAGIRLIDNKTSVPVRLTTDAEGGGGLEFIGYDLETRKATVRRLSFDGETEREISLGGAR
jgi:hypothetical protein